MEFKLEDEFVCNTSKSMLALDLLLAIICFARIFVVAHEAHRAVLTDLLLSFYITLRSSIERQ
jgi:hypothetical protein